jgi:DGQHR domain-containing protein
MSTNELHRISVIVPTNPFTPPDLNNARHCLCALDIERLMEWWPGRPHTPHRDAKRVRAIQRSLDWRRVAQIAAYLLQEEIADAGSLLNEIFAPIYEPRMNDPGREWPPQIRGTVKYARSSFPFFTNVLVHVNGATFTDKTQGIAEIGLDASQPQFKLAVIDGQHRVNGAYLALMLRRRNDTEAKFDIPAEVFLDLDPPGKEPRRQAQIFIDVNLYQKKVDRSLVADLFPTTRQGGPLDEKDRAQDIGRRLMLETGPLVGMIQIPGVKYGVRDVVTLATLNAAVEVVLDALESCEITNLESQTEFLAQVLDCWLTASGRGENQGTSVLDPSNVVYQGRVLVAILDLVPAILAHLRKRNLAFTSQKARAEITKWFRVILNRAGLIAHGKFIEKQEFKQLGFLGSGGIGRFRNLLWAASSSSTGIRVSKPERLLDLASAARAKAAKALT